MALRRDAEAWLLSAYAADSHRSWARWLTRSQTAWNWTVRELPGRHFRWRIRGNPLSWLQELPPGVPDLLVTTSMVDLATLRGLHPRLARVPAVYYFHENQFAYPHSADQHASIDPQMVQLYGALSAQRVLFNSAYNRDTFLRGVDGLIARLPDHTPRDLVAMLECKSAILPVPIATPECECSATDPALIVWNHRWEYDKAPALFVDAMIDLAARGVTFELALLGARPARVPEPLARLRRLLGDRILVDGKLDARDYLDWLCRASVVVSTAWHEFQGLAVLEAVAAGARPLVPDALCYPEQYPEPYRYPAGDHNALAARLQDWLTGGLPPAPDVRAWTEKALQPRWASELGQGYEEQVE